MLSARSAWTIWKTEHDQIREMLASIDGALRTNRWRTFDDQRALLAQLVENLQAFEEKTHRPKGLTLLAILRGRSAQADTLLDELQSNRERCDQMLVRALAILKTMQQADTVAATECASVLQQYRVMSLAHLEAEDTLLHSHTPQLLTAEEWSRVVSAISTVVESAGQAGGGTKPSPSASGGLR